MEGYIIEAGRTSKCDVNTLKGCGAKEEKYIAKMKAKDSSKYPAEIARLTKMSGKSMKPALLEWVNTRIALLQQLVGAKTEL